MSARNRSARSRPTGFLPGPATSSKWRVLVAVCLGLAMLMIDLFVVNVAFPAIGRDLDATLSVAEWTVSGYVLMVGVLPIAMGRLGDILGRRRVYLAGLTVFVAASVACGAAVTIEQLVVFRVVQGVGAATMFPTTLAIITTAFPPQQRGLAIGIWGGVSGLGLIAGPVLGGLLVHGDDWRWIFYVNLPVGLAAVALALLFVPESRDETAPRTIDWPGLALLASGLFAVMLGLTRANEGGWTSPLIGGCFLTGLALLTLFVMVERRARAPLIDLHLFRSPTFVMACVSAFLFSAAVFGSQPLTSLFMQNYLGFTPLQAGLGFLPATALVALMMPVSGILGQRLGSRLRLVVMTGSLAVALSCVPLLWLTTSSGYAHLLPTFVLRGTGIGLFMSASSLAVVSAAPLAKSGLASGTLTMARNVGTAMGVALLGGVFLHHVDSALPAQLADVPATQVAQVTTAAEHFLPAGPEGTRPQVEQAIVEGFVLVAAATLALSAVAMCAAFFIRYQAPTRWPSSELLLDPVTGDLFHPPHGARAPAAGRSGTPRACPAPSAGSGRD